MKRLLSVLLTSASIVAITSSVTVRAAEQPSQPQQIAQSTADVEEIVVTARRKEENLQTVPESVNAVTAGDIAKFNMTQFTDLQKIVPALQVSINYGVGSFGGSLRGLTYGVGSVASSLQAYLNDAPQYQATSLYVSMFDVADIEVLRGPQGTVRGEIADTGAITLTTRRPDLESIGGYGEVTIGQLQHTNVQAAVGAPIVPGKLAIRIAAMRDYNNDGGIGSLNYSAAPYRSLEGGRITVEFEPTDNIQAILTYQRMYQREAYYNSGNLTPAGPEFGPGNAACCGPLTVSDYKTIMVGQNNVSSGFDNLEGNFSWTFAGQKLESVTGFAHQHQNSQEPFNWVDQVPGANLAFPTTLTHLNQFNEDIRLSSVEPLFGRVDYTVGFFYNHEATTILANNGGYTYEPGAFGPPGGPYVPILNTRFAQLTSFTIFPEDQNEHAVYGNATVHITKKDEITAGVRYSQEQHDNLTTLSGDPAFKAVTTSAAGCAAVAGGQYGATYPGVCDEPVSPFVSVGARDAHTYHPVVYNVEASHRFNEDFMVYLRTASSWRAGALNPGLAPFTNNDPRFNYYLLPPPETSKDYEGGFKGSLFDHRLTFDADYFHQVYTNFFYTSQAVYHLQYTGTTPVAVNGTLPVPGLPAKVDGIEFNATGKITKEWTASTAFGWANGRVAGTGVCNLPGITSASTPAAALAALQAAGVIVNTCPGIHDTTARIPKWNLNISSEYDQPINDELQGFVRGLFDYHPSNSLTSFIGYTQPAYATLDLYLGLRRSDAQWEVSLYGKNITNNQTVLSIANVNPTTSLNAFFPEASTGYQSATVVPPREFGITMRYAFGSR